MMPHRLSLSFRNTQMCFSKRAFTLFLHYLILTVLHLLSVCDVSWCKACVYFLSVRGLSTENPDLVQLKSLLAGLTLPVKCGSSESSAEDGDGRSSNHKRLKRQQQRLTQFSRSLCFSGGVLLRISAAGQHLCLHASDGCRHDQMPEEDLQRRSHRG